MIYEVFQLMLEDLVSHSLSVGLVPNREGDGYVRVVVDRNCRWYRELCSSFVSGRKKKRKRSKHDTMIKRRIVIRTLERMIGGDFSGKYATDIEELIPCFILNREDYEDAPF